MRILIVDDEKLEREGLKFLFKRNGFDVQIEEASNGQEALAKLQEAHYDVLLTDVRMPVMDGLTLLKHTQEFESPPRSVIYSAYSDFVFAREAIRLNVMEYLVKPVEERAFVELITRLEKEVQEERNQLIENYLLMGTHGAKTLPEEFSFPCEGICVAVEVDEAIFLREHQAFKDVLEVFFSSCFFIVENELEGLLFILGESRNLYERLNESIHQIEERFGTAVRFYVFERFLRYEEIAQTVAQGKEKMEGRLFAPGSKVYLLLAKPDEGLYLNAPGPGHGSKPGDLTVFESVEALLADLRGKEQFSNLHTKYILLRLLERAHVQLSPEEIERFLNMGSLDEIESFLYETLGSTKEALHLTDVCNGDAEESEEAALVNAAKAYIDKHFQEDPNLETIAAHVHVSTNYLCAIFKQEIRQTVVAYLTEVKMNYAEYLLQNTYYKIKEVSEMVGYNNPSYFNMVFKNRYGITPTQYRRQMGREL